MSDRISYIQIDLFIYIFSLFCCLLLVLYLFSPRRALQSSGPTGTIALPCGQFYLVTADDKVQRKKTSGNWSYTRSGRMDNFRQLAPNWIRNHHTMAISLGRQHADNWLRTLRMTMLSMDASSFQQRSEAMLECLHSERSLTWQDCWNKRITAIPTSTWREISGQEQQERMHATERQWWRLD